MNNEQALKILGVAADQDSSSISAQFRQQRESLQERIDAAPDSLKDKFRENMAKLEEAYRYVTESQVNPIDLDSLPVTEKHLKQTSHSGVLGSVEQRYHLLSDAAEVGGWLCYRAQVADTGEDVTIRVFSGKLTKSHLARLDRQLSLCSSLSNPNFEGVLDYGVSEEGVWVASGASSSAKTFQPDSFQGSRKAVLACLHTIEETLDYLAMESGHGGLSLSSIALIDGRPVVPLPVLDGIVDPDRARNHYTAPEVRRLGVGSDRGDQYALAMLAAECLLQKSLRSDAVRKIEDSQLPEKSKACLCKALHDNPSKRYASNSQFLSALEESFVSPYQRIWAHPASKAAAILLPLVIIAALFFHQQFMELYEEHKPELGVGSQDYQMNAVKLIAESKELLAQVSAYKTKLEHEIDRAESYIVRLRNSTRTNRNEIGTAEAQLDILGARERFFSDNVMPDDVLTEFKSTLAVVDQLYGSKDYKQAISLLTPVHARLESAVIVGRQLEDEPELLVELSVLEQRHEKLSGSAGSREAFASEKSMLVEKQEALLAEGKYPELLSVYQSLTDLYKEEIARLEQAAALKANKANRAYLAEVEASLVTIPAGTFKMGLVRAGATDTRPVHDVQISTFKIGRYPVTNRMFNRFLQQKGQSRRSPDDHPVVNVSWEEAVGFTKWLSRLSGNQYRLVTEAEWEYVARAGARTTFAWGDRIGRNHANCADCGSQWDGASASPVGSFEPNAFGVYDMNGNVWEWTQDCYAPSYRYAPTNGTAMEIPDCQQRVVRGGAWNTPGKKLHPALRSTAPMKTKLNSLGFRVARSH